MEQRISLVTLGVSDVGRAREFYGRLGWAEPGPRLEEVAFFQAGGMVLALWGLASLAADCGREEAAAPGGVALAQNLGSPEEVDALLAEARAAGATIVREGAPTDWGGYSGLFTDPDGHPWEIAHNPHWTLADDGTVRLPSAG